MNSEIFSRKNSGGASHGGAGALPSQVGEGGDGQGPALIPRLLPQGPGAGDASSHGERPNPRWHPQLGQPLQDHQAYNGLYT